MDIGCRFYTPKDISDGIATHAGAQKLVVDLFSGSGNLHKAFLRKNYATEALALDINPLVCQLNNSNGQVVSKTVDCLNPNTIKKELNGRSHIPSVFTLNPPFKRISKDHEILYWKNFNNFKPRFLTQRIECIAIAAALQAAPQYTKFYVILPEIVLFSQVAEPFFEALKNSYSMTLINTYKRAWFSSAEVDVAVIKLKKNNTECITKSFERQVLASRYKPINKNSTSKIINNFKLFRGKVRHESERKYQISVKHLRIGGIDIKGNFLNNDLLKAQENNYSVDGDILIARVGPRMIGRVGIVHGNCVLTNESIVTLRIYDSNLREAIYKVLTSPLFVKWCNTAARGTANYFLANSDIKKYISQMITEN